MCIRNGGELWHAHGRVPRIFKYTYTEVLKIVLIHFPFPFQHSLNIMDATFNAPSLEHLQRHDPSHLVPMERRYHNVFTYAVTV